MKIRFFLVLLVAAFLWNSPNSVQAQDPTPSTGLTAPVPPETSLTIDQAEETLASPEPTALQLPSLRAVIVVGPLDGTNGIPGTVTTREINNAELAARKLEANGVTVSRFYTPNNNWDQIKAAANGAHFFMYRGHGIYWGPLPNPPVGGMGLYGKIYSNDEIRAGLKLAPNAIVMIYSCFSSGSSDTDTTSITITEARRRIDEYSAPYLDLGAGGVFANWYGDAFEKYIDYLFQGMTLGQALQTFWEFDAADSNLGTHPTRPGLDFWLEWENWDDFWIPAPQYDTAFVGKSGATLQSLFAPLMELSSESITLLVKPNATAQNYNIAVNSSWDYNFNWNAGDPVTWVNTTPTSGQSGDYFTIQVLPGGSTGTFNTHVTVTTTDPLVINKTEEVNVRLVVTNTIYKVFIPVARR